MNILFVGLGKDKKKGKNKYGNFDSALFNKASTVMMTENASSAIVCFEN